MRETFILMQLKRKRYFYGSRLMQSESISIARLENIINYICFFSLCFRHSQPAATKAFFPSVPFFLKKATFFPLKNKIRKYFWHHWEDHLKHTTLSFLSLKFQVPKWRVCYEIIYGCLLRGFLFFCLLSVMSYKLYEIEALSNNLRGFQFSCEGCSSKLKLYCQWALSHTIFPLSNNPSSFPQLNWTENGWNTKRNTKSSVEM